MAITLERDIALTQWRVYELAYDAAGVFGVEIEAGSVWATSAVDAAYEWCDRFATECYIASAPTAVAVDFETDAAEWIAREVTYSR